MLPNCGHICRQGRRAAANLEVQVVPHTQDVELVTTTLLAPDQPHILAQKQPMYGVREWPALFSCRACSPAYHLVHRVFTKQNNYNKI